MREVLVNGEHARRRHHWPVFHARHELGSTGMDGNHPVAMFGQGSHLLTRDDSAPTSSIQRDDGDSHESPRP